MKSGVLKISAIVLCVMVTAASVQFVFPTEPEADAGGDLQVIVGEPLSFDGSGSVGSNLGYNWFFGDVTDDDHTPAFHVSDEPTAEFTYWRTGVYQVVLFVEERMGFYNGEYDKDVIQVTVTSGEPSASIWSSATDGTAEEEEEVTFRAEDVEDTDEYSWDLGDGTLKSWSDDMTEVKHSYQRSGEYNIILRLRRKVNSDYYVYNETHYRLIVTNEPPEIVDIEISTDTIYMDETVEFTAVVSDTVFDEDSLRFSWDFGDGTMGHQKSAVHTYTRSGEYVVTLTVTDNDDDTVTESIVVDVNNVEPVADIGEPRTVMEGRYVPFDGFGQDTPSDQPLLTYDWSFQNSEMSSISGESAWSRWYRTGEYTAGLNVTDPDGASDTAVTDVTVLNTDPIAGMDKCYIDVNMTLRVAGERWHDVYMELYENERVIHDFYVFRLPGNPDEQSQTIHDIRLDLTANYTAKAYYTPEDDPISGTWLGADPAWIDIDFRDGSRNRLHHTFNVVHESTWNWTENINEALMGSEITFEALAFDWGADDLTFRWNFGDGTIVENLYPSEDPLQHSVVRDTVTHRYSTEDRFELVLDVYDHDGGETRFSTVIHNKTGDGLKIDNVAPQAYAGEDFTVSEDEVAVFDAVGYDSEEHVDDLVYHWYFDDGSEAVGQTVEHSYVERGVYSVLLIVTDPEGAVGTDMVRVSVENVAPGALIDVNTDEIYEDDTVHFSAVDVSDTVSDIPTLRYAWDFGDGTRGAGKETSHVYTRCGEYTVTLWVIDNNDARKFSTTKVNVNNLAPYDVYFTSREHDGTESDTFMQNQLIYFDAFASDTPSDVPLLEYEWNFGDGNLGSGTHVIHEYDTSGTHTVKLTVTDDDGAFTVHEDDIQVDNVKPTSQVMPGVSSFVFSGNISDILPFTFTGMGFDTPGDMDTLTYSWELRRNGNIIDDSTGETYELSGIYTGDYTLKLTVTDIDGAKSVSEIQVSFIHDTDNDGLPDVYENIVETDPLSSDTDGDGIPDPIEIFVHETDPLSIDTDGDGLTDFEEIFGVYGFTSDPLEADTSGDGLLDGEARYSMAFAMNDRVKVPSSDPITVDNVWVRAPLLAIERGEIRLGLTHTKLDELTITAKAGDEEAELPIPDDPGQYLYTSFDVFELGFTRSCLNKTEQWTFTVEGGGSGKGYIEYIELNVVMWTDPNSVDSNNDGLSDIEQLRRGEYGWLTDPWNEDTDGDGVSDLLEITGWSWGIVDGDWQPVQDDDGFQTDPLNPDTDGDGVPDGEDIDPLHELVVQVTIEDVDRSGSDYFATIDVSQEGEETKNVATPKGGDAAPRTYMFHVSDTVDRNEIEIRIDGWDEEGWIFVKDEEQMSISLTYDLIEQNQITDTDGVDDFTITYSVNTVALEKANTVLVNATGGEIYETEDVEIRYTGEQKFYTFMLDVDDDGEIFDEGANLIVVSRHTFGQSYLNQTLMGNKEDLPEVLEDLDFSYRDDDEETSSGAVVAIVSGEVSYDDAVEILNMLLHSDEEYDISTANYNVLDDPVTAGIATDVIRLIPWTGFVMDEQGPGPGSWSDIFGEWFSYVADAANLLVQGLVAIGNFIVDMVNAVVQWGLKLWNGIWSFFSDVKAAVSEVVEMVKSLVNWVIDLATSLAESIFIPFINTILDVITGYMDNIAMAIQSLFDSHPFGEWEPGDALCEESVQELHDAIMGNLFFVVTGIVIAINVILVILQPFSFSLTLIAPLVGSLLMLLLLQHIAPGKQVDDGENPGIYGTMTIEGLFDFLEDIVDTGGSNDTDLMRYVLNLLLATLGVIFSVYAYILAAAVVNAIADVTGATTSALGLILSFVGLVIAIVGLVIAPFPIPGIHTGIAIISLAFTGTGLLLTAISVKRPFAYMTPQGQTNTKASFVISGACFALTLAQLRSD